MGRRNTHLEPTLHCKTREIPHRIRIAVVRVSRRMLYIFSINEVITCHDTAFAYVFFVLAL